MAWALGSIVRFTAYHADRAAAERALDAVLVELDTIEDVMSLYREESQLRQLNRNGRLKHADSRLLDVLHAAHRMSRRSDGAFDITVQPLWEVFRESQEAGRLPSDQRIERALSTVDYRKVVWDDGTVRLRGGATRITLNGIAQGYALDRTRKILESAGVHHALLDTGEIGTAGVRPGGRDWHIGIQHPRQGDAFAGIVPLDGRCLATSGDYATRFSADFSAHHIFDPRTGRSPREIASVSVLAPSGILADALSTALCVLGAEEGRALLQAFPKCDAFFVLKDGRSVRTPRFPLERA